MKAASKRILGCLALCATVTLAGCAAPTTTPSPTASVSGSNSEADVVKFPDVLSATADCSGDLCSFNVTISSPYDTAERYADGWRILAPDGTVLGEHKLGHDHRTEQPFTRTQPDVTVPESVDSVTVQGRDQVYGYGGTTVDVDVSDR